MKNVGRISLGPTGSASLDPFIIPKQDAPKPAMLVLPGGGYSFLAEHEGEPIARWLNTIGYSAFVVNYRVSPSVYPAPLDDAMRAIDALIDRAGEFQVDVKKIGAIGFSAGGHLAGLLATEPTSHPLAATVLCYPVVSFERYPHQGSVAGLLGNNPEASMLAKLSIEQRISEATPPMFVWHTANDQLVSVGHSLILAESMNRARRPIELHVFPEGNHGLGLAGDRPDVAQWTGLCERFLQRTFNPRDARIL